MNSPILLIPGLNATPRAFQAQLDTLYRFGGVSIADHRQGSTMAEIATAILRDAPPRFGLGGFSMGGYIAFEIMRQAPERVERLLLIDTSARPDTPEAKEKRRGGIDLAKAGKFQLTVANTFPNAVHPANAENEIFKAIHLVMAKLMGPEVYVRHQEAIMARPDSRPDLKKIAVPTLIIVGDKDQITPLDAAEEMAAGIVGSELVVIEKAGHLALIEEPTQVNKALARWFGGGD